MKNLPRTVDSLVLRTDFSDDAAWLRVCEEIRRPVGDFRANVECVSDTAFEDASPEQLAELGDKPQWRSFLFVVDSTALIHPEHPLLVVGLQDADRGRTFRVIPSEMWGVENNLSLANMDFAEFADAADADGIFRGFPGSPPASALAARAEPSMIVAGKTRLEWEGMSPWSRLIAVARWLIGQGSRGAP